VPRPERWTGKPIRFGRLDRLSQLALVAAHGALESASAPGLAAERIGLVLGTACGAHLSNELFWRSLQQPDAASPGLFAYTLPSSAAGEISIHLGIKGPCLTLAHDTTSGLAALALGAHLLAAGSADWVLAGGVDVLGVTRLRSHGAIGTASEGAAFVLLTRAETTQAALAGVGQASGEESRPRAVAAALQQAELRVEELSATVDGEWSEGVAVFGECLAARPLLGLCAALARSALPCLVVAAGPEGTCALCLAS
jgi:3-oxoacyl-(acyl-carrier-protein) synthase